jgi:hypothetical protein
MRPNPSQRDGDGGENHGNEKGHDTEKALEQATDKWDEAVCVCVCRIKLLVYEALSYLCTNY